MHPGFLDRGNGGGEVRFVNFTRLFVISPDFSENSSLKRNNFISKGG